jgi:hypothetical protein
MSFESEYLSEQESQDLLTKLFPGGVDAPELRQQLASVDSISPEELSQLLGDCLWDILSNNHELILPGDRIAHLSSFRGTAGIIAAFLGDHSEYGYMRFYMGTHYVKNRTLVPVIYRHIFGRLKELGIDWIYSFPQTFAAPDPKLEEDQPEGFENYDPSASFAASEEERHEQEMLAKLQELLQEQFQKLIEEAKSKPPPQTVQAYHEVYGKWPLGWPPWEQDERSSVHDRN